jgi:hypothetical protein
MANKKVFDFGQTSFSVRTPDDLDLRVAPADALLRAEQRRLVREQVTIDTFFGAPFVIVVGPAWDPEKAR